MENVHQFPEVAEEKIDESKPEKSKEIKREYLINKLNYINFQDGTILVNFKHKKYEQVISLHAKPKPCAGNELSCVWANASGLRQTLTGYKFQNLHIPDGPKLLMVQPDLLHITTREIHFRLPDAGWELRYRKSPRHCCEGINLWPSF